MALEFNQLQDTLLMTLAATMKLSFMDIKEIFVNCDHSFDKTLCVLNIMNVLDCNSALARQVAKSVDFNLSILTKLIQQ